VGFVVDKVALGQVFPPSSLVFPCQFHSTGAPLLGKGQKIIIIFIIITGLHNKPQGCGASVASAAGPFTTKKKEKPIPVAVRLLDCWDRGFESRCGYGFSSLMFFYVLYM
jgi:hypothetical protein